MGTQLVGSVAIPKHGSLKPTRKCWDELHFMRLKCHVCAHEWLTIKCVGPRIHRGNHVEPHPTLSWVQSIPVDETSNCLH